MKLEPEIKKTLLKVSVADGVIEDNLAKHLGWVYDQKVYDANFNRKKEYFGLHTNHPKN